MYGLLAVGVFFTVRLGLPQIRHFAEMFRVIRSAPETDNAGITPLQALTVSLASRVRQPGGQWSPWRKIQKDIEVDIRLLKGLRRQTVQSGR